jgi:hypothetical protein
MAAGRAETTRVFSTVLLLGFGLFGGPGCRTAPDPERWAKDHHYRATETIRLQFDRHGFPLVPGKIGQRDVKVFFDTGNFFGFLVGPRLIRDLGLLPSGHERRNYDSGGNFRYSQKGYLVRSFTVFSAAFEDIEMFEMTDDTFDAGVGVQTLLDKRLTLDYRRGLMGLSGVPLERRVQGGEGLPLLWNDRLKGMIVVEGRVDGVDTLFQIDTGKSRTTIDADLIALAGLKENNTPFLKGYKLDRVLIGGKEFTVECAKVADFKAISEGYPKPILVGIGADILSQIILTVDYPRKKVLIE